MAEARESEWRPINQPTGERLDHLQRRYIHPSLGVGLCLRRLLVKPILREGAVSSDQGSNVQAACEQKRPANYPSRQPETNLHACCGIRGCPFGNVSALQAQALPTPVNRQLPA